MTAREKAGFTSWLADNGVLFVVAAGAYGGSLSHWLRLAERYGQGGITGWFIAACVDLLAFEAARERQVDAKMRRKLNGPVSFPIVVLTFSVLLTLAGNAWTAQPTAGGILLALIPGVALLLSIGFVERRASERGRQARAAEDEAERERVAGEARLEEEERERRQAEDADRRTREAEAAARERQAEAERQADERRQRQSERQSELALRHAAIAGPASASVSPAVTAGGERLALVPGTGPSPSSATDVMRAFWDRERAAGRMPSGADLLRAAGLSPESSLGRQKRAKWLQDEADADAAEAVR